jgi:hypothetical protein
MREDEVKKSHWRARAFFFCALAALGLLFASAPGFAGSTATATGKSSERQLTEGAEGRFEVLEAADQYAEARTSPAESIDAGAFTGAYAATKNLPVSGGPWSEITKQPYDSDAHGYRDPVWSNSGGGSGLVAGRMTALALDGNTLYAGAADGGVWKRQNGNWTPLTDDAPTLSIGSLAVDSAHGLWVGTGEANTSSDSYTGIGVLYKAAGSSNFVRVGGDELENHVIGKIVFDNGYALAATSKGLYRHSATSTSGAWAPVLKQGIGGVPPACTFADGEPGVAFISDAAVKPGTGGRIVDAVVGWRAGSNCNGFYESADYGQTFAPVVVNGAINDKDLARTQIAYSADGSKLYALVQGAGLYNGSRTDFAGTLLQGIYESPGSLAGSWTKVSEWRQLQHSGSALNGVANKGYRPGVQAWYNQFLAVDPANADHVFAGLEEVYESKDGGSNWNTVGPYWNFGLPCSTGPQGLDGCNPTTHSDQHAIAFGNGNVYVGNDGGVYSRGLNGSAPFASLNNGLRTLQYYYADAGKVAGGDAIWGGLQDNGESLLLPGASTMVSPFGGDGGDTLVDKNDGNKAVVEYVGLDMALTTNGGQSSGAPGSNSFREISPSCFAFTYVPSPCDANARFIAPFEPDAANANHWVAGGRYVWDNENKGWATSCGASACDWKIKYDTGAGHSITAIGVNGVSYVGWCGPCNFVSFNRGLATNYGGSWHALSLPASFPKRFIQAITVDRANPAHVYVVFNGFSRRWTNDASAGDGHVYESSDAGVTWTNISGNSPDAPGDDLVLTSSGKLVLATDIGVFVAPAGQGAATAWSRLGGNLPNASTNDVALSPDGSYLIAATHGRGLWKIATP